MIPSPALDRPWLNDRHRAALARTFACEPSEVEARLDAWERMDAIMAERREREGADLPPMRVRAR